MHTTKNHNQPKTQSPRGAAQQNGNRRVPETARPETRQANPTPPTGMKGGVEGDGRAVEEVGLIETQSTINNEPRNMAQMQTAGTPPTPPPPCYLPGLAGSQALWPFGVLRARAGG